LSGLCSTRVVRQPGILRTVGGERGLARGHQAEGVFTVYSAGLGQTALDTLGTDDASPNSVFTRVLLPALARADLHLSDLIIDMRQPAMPRLEDGTWLGQGFTIR
jgi:hypothetical protein